ncbi:MAG: hypothetical protein KJ944_10010 [Alphaproteobacteria bacterium]|nr:hypothetical protein [Alphaproteobacteria bacterium]MBU1560712.1 hypothetical protein [Alphaproteobacteria bacterium]MBU2302921.1 hypothetical protein [Alphaproteobacteria bacterium]MBU2367648.1 hypothetical protein [Alphaproteobacteria bacterium]
MLDADAARPKFASTIPVPERRRRRSLRQAAETLVLVHPSVKRLSDDGAIEEMAHDLMIGADDFAAINVAVSGREVTLVCVCSPAWRVPGRHAFFELKAVAAASGRTVVLVPERFIRREPRLANAMLIAGAQGAEIGLTDRMKILAHLVENGGSAPLLDLAVMVRGEEPVDAVMALVIEGGLYIDLDRPILPSTEVHLVQPL